MGLKFLVLGGKEKVPPYLSPGGIVQPIILDGDADPAVECRVETFDSVCCQEQHTLMVPSCSIGHTSVRTENPKKKAMVGTYSSFLRNIPTMAFRTISCRVRFSKKI